MTKIITLLILINITLINAQETASKMGPILNDFGQVFQIANPELTLDSTKVYKVIFDVYTNPSKKEGSINPLLNTVARYLNMHAQYGVPAKNMKVVVVLHGAATKSALNTEGFTSLFKTENPDLKLINALNTVDVKLFVCGQSFLAYGYDVANKTENVKLSLSALTALVKYQSEGYQLITFN